MRTDDASLPELTSRPNEIGRLLDQTGLDAISRYRDIFIFPEDAKNILQAYPLGSSFLMVMA
jgi:hypothetical protein